MFSRRIFAFLIDLVVINIISNITVFIFSIINIFEFGLDNSLKLLPIIFIIYFVSFDIFNGGDTIGKKYAKIKMQYEVKNYLLIVIFSRALLKCLFFYVFILVLIYYFIFNKILIDEIFKGKIGVRYI